MIPKIDAHHHLWKYDPVIHGWIDDSMQVIQRDFYPNDLLPALDENGVVGTVLVQVDMTDADNVFSLAQAANAPFIKAIVGWVDLLAPDLNSQLEKWKAQPLMKGFRHIAQAEPDDFLARPDVIWGIDQLGGAGFTFDILIKPPQLEAAVKLVRALPHQPFVVDHVAKPYIPTGEIETWAKGMVALAENENVLCKISGMVTEADWRHWSYDQLLPYMETVLEAFGPNRLMFGSDWPVCLVATSYTQWVQVVERFVSSLTVSEQEAIWHHNASRFYQL
jgi:L-fuconolactonase